MNTSTRESRARLVRAPWLWLALTYLVLAVGSFVLYGGADYPGLFADSPGALEAGSERDAAIEAWEDRYFEVGLPFAIAAGITTFAWLLALGERWLLLTALVVAATLALAALNEQAAVLLAIFLVPLVLLLFIPWQVVAIVLAGVAALALASKPARERLGLHVAALYVGFSAQVIFTALSFLMSRGTFG